MAVAESRSAIAQRFMEGLVKRRLIILAVSVMTVLAPGRQARAEDADLSARTCEDKPAVTPEAIIDAYVGPHVSKDRAVAGNRAAGLPDLPSAASFAGEAAQILGQIVVDRASQAAYVQLTKKLMGWMHCDAKAPASAGAAQVASTSMSFPSTCGVIKNLRPQDLAMSPAVLRQALVADAVDFLLSGIKLPDSSLRPANDPSALSRDSITAQRSMFAASIERSSSMGDATVRSSGEDATREQATRERVRSEQATLLHVSFVRRFVPVLGRSLESLTGRNAEVEIRDIVGQALEIIKNKKEGFCALENQPRVLATAALAFAACELRCSGACPVMQYVRELEASCSAPAQSAPAQPAPPQPAPPQPAPAQPVKPLTYAQLTYAQSIAGHLVDAFWLQSTDKQATGKERLVAAVDAAFEIACMYAVTRDDGTGYECRVDETAHLPTTAVAPTETVALARDLVHAALDRDSTALAAVIVRAAVRYLPAPKPGEQLTEPKAIRALATIAAYAATYTSPEQSKDAHQQRTALLESLTRDMTVRTDRGGDVIVGLGGALRGVVGGRMGRSTQGSRPTAFASPLSLTLGAGIDYLFVRKEQGLHVEVGVLDLGQYLAWDEGAKVITPDLSVALSPSLTFAYFWHREIPLYVGATVGYTPRYDFAPDGDKPRGAFNAGLVLGAYVPLFDFN